MPTQQQFFTLNHRVVFYVPSTNHSTPITPEEFTTRTNEIASSMSEWFGGASIEAIQGFYKSNTGQVIVESINKVIAFTSDDSLRDNSQKLLQLAVDKKTLWQQESIGVEIDNQFMLVD